MVRQAEEGTVGPREQSRPEMQADVRLRVRCANTQQPCFSALCDAWLLQKRDKIRESSYIKYRAILERHIKPRLGSRRLGGICTASVDAFTAGTARNGRAVCQDRA